MKLRSLFLVAALVGATACSAIPVQMHTTTHIQHADGTVEHRETHWQGTLDQLPAQLGKAGEDLEAVTTKMAKELVDVPPPGQVKLSDLAPSLAKHQGEKGADFLADAKNVDGTPIDFKYTRLGVSSYDDFFKTAQELYALLYQAKQTVHRMREAASAALDNQVDPNAELKALVDRAVSNGASDSALVTNLKSLEDVSTSLGALLSQIGQKIGKLVSTGQALVAAAPSSLTNPKVAAHLPLVKEGLTDSIKVIKESGGLVIALGKELANFSSG